MQLRLTLFINCCWILLFLIRLLNAKSYEYPNQSTCLILPTRIECNGTFTDIVENVSNVKEIRFSNFKTKTLNLNIVLEKLPNLELISVEKSEISNVLPPKHYNTVKELRFHNLKIKRISRDFVSSFPSLKVLRLEHNTISDFSEHFHVGTLEEMYVRYNKWNCKRDLSWALRLNETGVVKDILNTTCKDELYHGKSMLLIAEYKKTMQENCTKLCECSLEYVVEDPVTSIPSPIIMVNCSRRGLSELPEHLPSYTRILHLESNNITDIKPLKTNSTYRQLWDLYLDNNMVDSIAYLEGSYWLSHFRVFSLKGNKLSKLPCFVLDNALMKNPNMPKAVTLFLGGNPWICDCIFTPVFQELVLQKYSIQIEDIRDVKCANVKGDENSLTPIINLSRSSVCIVPTDFSLQEGLDILNAILASLIVFILGKLAYDYYHFKKSGKLPWIISKIP